MIKSYILIALYLAAIVAANNIVTYMGPSGLFITATFLIPFDLIARDQLQENWRGSYMLPKMAAVICLGSILAYLFNSDTKLVSAASAVSFLIAGSIDCFLYTILDGKKKFIKMNLSNLGASIADSFIFQWIAFGAVSYTIAWQQITLKLLGGLFWSVIFVKVYNRALASRDTLRHRK